MVCCVIPCFIKEKSDNEDEISTKTVVSGEIIRWVAIIVPMFLSVWQYAEIRGYPDLTGNPENKVTHFWLIVTGCILGVSLFLYVPLRVAFTYIRRKLGHTRDGSWRPSIVAYIILCALPCLVLILVATETDPGTSLDFMDPVTITVLQITVLGLTITEWVAKVKEEVITFDLVGAMAMDFFFAYDVIAFIMMSAYEPNIYHSNWVFVCFIFAFIAMFKYIPTQPVNLLERGSSQRHVTCILVSLFCCDIPFLVIRLSTMIIYGFRVSDLIFPVKNLALIFFQGTQLFMIHIGVGLATQPKVSESLDNMDAMSEGLGTLPVQRRSRKIVCTPVPNSISGDQCECVTMEQGENLGAT